VTIGVLALQGDVREHSEVLASLGEVCRPVRTPDDLPGLRGMVLPGGESTTLSMLLESSGLFDPLADALRGGLAVLGTCAGMILLAARVVDGRPDQRHFGLIDLTVRRNGYGRQEASFECPIAAASLGDPPVPAVFIRAPLVEEAGPGVEVLASLPSGPRVGGADHRRREGGDGTPVLCRQGRVLVAAFHPELTTDRRVHRLFVEMTKTEA